jgi:hypothetical protein
MCRSPPRFGVNGRRIGASDELHLQRALYRAAPIVGNLLDTRLVVSIDRGLHRHACRIALCGDTRLLRNR